MRRLWQAILGQAILAGAALMLAVAPAQAQQSRTAAAAAVVLATGAAADDLLANNRLATLQRTHLAEVRAEQGRTARALNARNLSEQDNRRLRARQAELDAEVQALVEQARAQGLINADQERVIDHLTQTLLGGGEAPDSAKLQCLEDFGRGLRLEAEPCIRDINDARVRARAAAAAEIDAARRRADADDLRQTALLTLQMLQQGEKTLAVVIADWERVIAVSDDAWDAIDLSRLYLRGGRTTDAARAAERAVETATDMRDRSAALDSLGDTYLRLNRTAEALDAYQRSEAIARALAQADEGNTEAQRDLSVSLERLGDIRLELGQSEDALAAYRQSEAIFRALAEASENDAASRFSLSISLINLGKAYLELEQFDAALAAFDESAAIRRILAQADEGDARAQTDLLYPQSVLCALRQPGACEALGRHAAKVEDRGWLTPEQAAYIRNLIAENAP